MPRRERERKIEREKEREREGGREREHACALASIKHARTLASIKHTRTLSVPRSVSQSVSIVFIILITAVKVLQNWHQEI